MRGGYYYLMANPDKVIGGIVMLDGYFGGSAPSNNFGSLLAGFENFTGIEIIPESVKP